MDKKRIGNKILYFPLTKIIIGLFVYLGAINLGKLLIGLLPSVSTMEIPNKNMVMNTGALVLSIISYKLLYQFYEKRKITELSLNGQGIKLISGIAVGILLQSLTVLVIYLNKSFTVISTNSIILVLPSLLIFTVIAISEEIIFRGIIFRITEEKLGSYLALAISGILFGLIHLLNPNSTITVTLGIAIQAGLLLGAAYMYTRNLWFPIAIHFAWNFMQSAIFGANTSGITIGKSLLVSKIEGATWITGGEFGPEGSIQATVFCLSATIIIMILNHRQNKIIQPFWKR